MHLALVGPTASGKSDLAVRAARELGDVEIVSVDSMQVYRGMDVGTAKATPAERGLVPHHLIDVAEPGEDWSVVRFQELARSAIREIEGRGHRALLVGGTGLYFRSVVDALEIPAADPALRVDLEAESEAPGGADALYRRLNAVDPVAASRTGPTNLRRMVRALEAIEASGRTFSSSGPGLAEHPHPAFPVLINGVWLPRRTLARRIVERFSQMADQGLVEEVEVLAARPGGLSRTARQAIGYREVLGYLEGTIPSLAEAFTLAANRTRGLARRQRMWFRRDHRIAWLGAPEDPDSLLPALLATWKAW
ncbi:MAG: tRNA (adenosine(37)-N6)-dimethylallyltransferase MiaA [Acidimicrobiia bacterium]